MVISVGEFTGFSPFFRCWIFQAMASHQLRSTAAFWMLELWKPGRSSTIGLPWPIRLLFRTCPWFCGWVSDKGPFRKDQNDHGPENPQTWGINEGHSLRQVGKANVEEGCALPAILWAFWASRNWSRMCSSKAKRRLERDGKVILIILQLFEDSMNKQEVSPISPGLFTWPTRPLAIWGTEVQEAAQFWECFRRMGRCSSTRLAVWWGILTAGPNKPTCWFWKDSGISFNTFNTFNAQICSDIKYLNHLNLRFDVDLCELNWI